MKFRKIIVWTTFILFVSFIPKSDVEAIQNNIYPDVSTLTGYHWTEPAFPSYPNDYCCCYTPDQCGKLQAGYFCCRDGGYKTRLIQRTTFKFNLSSLPLGTTVDSAKLYLWASNIYHNQDIYVYGSTNDEWTAGNCHAFLFQNCPSCGPSYDPGFLAYQDTVYVSSTGWKSWDATNFIKDEHNNGQTYSTLHLRSSTEELADCNGCWDTHCIRFYGPTSSQKPYLEIDYCYNDSYSCSTNDDCCSGLTCVDNTCRSCVSKSCSADDAEDSSISEMGDAIDDIYCAWNIHDGCTVKSDVETIDGSNNPDYWEGEDCVDSGSSDLWGEKKVYIDDINDYNIKGQVCVDDYNSFWINEVQANVLENGSAGCTGLQNVSAFFQTGWNTIKFKAVDTCSDNRYMDIDWEIAPRAPALNGIAGSSSTVNLSWLDRGAGATYHLYNFNTASYIYSGTETDFIHTGLNANTTYSYQVKAVKNGAESDWSNSVSATTWNQLPTADAGSDQFIIIGSSVSLDGSGSNDPDGDPISYDWTFNSIPGTSFLTDADFSDETIVNPSFTPDVIGVYLIELKVTDIPYGGFNTNTVSITITDPLPVCGNNIIEGDEECDGTDDALCPGECVAPGEIKECFCPQSMPKWKETKPKKE